MIRALVRLFQPKDRSPAQAVGWDPLNGRETVVRTGEHWEIERFVERRNASVHERDQYRVRPIDPAVSERAVFVVEPKERSEKFRIEKTMDGLHWFSRNEADAALVQFELRHPETIGRFAVRPARLQIEVTR